MPIGCSDVGFTNSYKAPQPPAILPDAELYGPDPYDLNFCFPVHHESLRTERVALTPLIPSIHGDALWDAISSESNLDLFKFCPFTFHTHQDALTFLERDIRANPTRIMFVIIDHARPDHAHPEFGGSLAGVVGLSASSTQNLTTDIDHVLIFPAFQRTHVTGNAIGVLMKHCLDRYDASPPGLALRRVQWTCHPENVKSASLAEKVGLKREGVMKWHTAVSREWAVLGKKASEDDPFPDMPW